MSQWYYLTVSSSATPYFFCLQSFPVSRSFPMNWLFTSCEKKYWGFSFSISLSNEYSGLISFRIDWLDILAFQRALRRLLQNHSLKSSVLRFSAFFMVQLSSPYMTTGTIISLTIWTLVGRVMSAFQHTVSVCYSFSSKKHCLLISWLQSPSAVILESKKRKAVTISTFNLLFAMK